MVWFSCEDCGDSVKKPKLQAHMSHCSASRLTCIDCNATFGRNEVKGHTKCVTEHEKYAQGLTKIPGFLGSAIEPSAGSKANQQQALSDLDAAMLHGPPWKCRLCNVSCTSKDTLIGHMAGAKHKRKARATERTTPRTETPANKPSPAAVPSSDTQMEALAPKRQKTETSKPAPGASIECKAVSKKEEEAEVHGHAEELPAAKPVKWKRLVSRELASLEGMKLKNLVRHVLLAAGKVDCEDAEAELRQKLSKSSQFQIQDNFVRLVRK